MAAEQPDPKLFLGLDADAWGAIFNGVNALVVVVGVVFAIYNLRLITKQQYFDAFTRFMDDLAETAPHRARLFQIFPRQDSYDDLSAEDRACATEVVNFLNRTATLIEERMLPGRVVLSLIHTVILRCWYKLELFLAHQEQVSGGRYGRRLMELERRARNYHDARPHQRGHAIRMYDPTTGPGLIIYQTTYLTGFAGVLQRCTWWARRVTGRY